MKKAILGAVLLFGIMPFTANAGLITDTVTVNNWFNSWGETESWVHDINDDGFTAGFDTVNSASLSFSFTDDNDWWAETAAIVIHNIDLEDGGLFEIDPGFLNLNVGVSGVASLDDFGILSVSITRLTGDFGLGNVTLTADVTPGVAAVPEPGTLALLGLGILGFTATRRKAA